MKNLILIGILLLQGSQLVSKDREVHGSVVDSEGRPVSRAAIEAVGWEGKISGNTVRLISKDDGTFSLNHLVAGKYRLYAWKESAGIPNTRALIFESSAALYSEVNINSEVPDAPITLKLPTAYGKISGHIVDSISKLPISKVRIRLERKEQPDVMYETDAEIDGGYMLLLPARPLKIIISAPGYRPWVYRGGDGQESIVLESKSTLTVNVDLVRL